MPYLIPIRILFSHYPKALRRGSAVGLAVLLGLTGTASADSTATLADQPVFASADVPGNLALALSVEFPTAISVANLNDYADASTYLGYFDPLKCYTYTYDSTTPSNSYFQPASLATGTNLHQCSGQWSGNFMNWATMQTIDPFRWALSGGLRTVDTTTQTILEKAWASNQGAISNFPYRGTAQATGNKLAGALVATVTPFTSWTTFNSSIWKRASFSAYCTSASGLRSVNSRCGDGISIPFC